MIKKIFLFFFLFNLFNYSYASIENKIINNFKKINNISFNFKQKINDKTEKGNCVIQYPKKINCKYDNLKKKLIVSNGKSLVIKNQNGKEYFRYLLNQTSLELILDKDLLLKKIEEIDGKIVDKKYYVFYLENNGKTLCSHTFFFWVIKWEGYDSCRNSLLVSVQFADLYQSSRITMGYIHSTERNILFQNW